MNLFELLPERARARLETAAEQVRVRTDEYVIRRGEEDGDLFRLESGQLEVVDRTARPEVVLNRLKPGAVVGEMSFINRTPRSADVRAASDAVLLRWRRERLSHTLSLDPFLATEFYRATSQILVDRLGALNRAAASGGLGAEATNPGGGESARGLIEELKSELRQVETGLRAGQREKGKAQAALKAFLEGGRELFAGLDREAGAAAGRLLYDELHPYLGRTRLAGMTQVGAPLPKLLGHLVSGRPDGEDAMGRALDAALQDLPTARALRAREAKTAQVAESLIPRRAGRVTALGLGTGKLLAGLGREIARREGELTCVDNDEGALERLREALAVSAPTLRLQIRPEDLGLLAQGRSDLYLSEQHVFVIDGLVEYLPERIFASLASTILELLAPGGAAIFNLLSWSEDAFFFEHLLSWPTIRRDPAEAVELLTEVGYAPARVLWKSGPGAVILGKRPEI